MVHEDEQNQNQWHVQKWQGYLVMRRAKQDAMGDVSTSQGLVAMMSRQPGDYKQGGACHEDSLYNETGLPSAGTISTYQPKREKSVILWAEKGRCLVCKLIFLPLYINSSNVLYTVIREKEKDKEVEKEKLWKRKAVFQIENDKQAEKENEKMYYKKNQKKQVDHKEEHY